MDEFTAAEAAYQNGYRAGLQAQYGETVGTLYRENDYLRSKIRFLENQLRKVGENVQV